MNTTARKLITVILFIVVIVLISCVAVIFAMAIADVVDDFTILPTETPWR